MGIFELPTRRFVLFCFSHEVERNGTKRCHRWGAVQWLNRFGLIRTGAWHTVNRTHYHRSIMNTYSWFHIDGCKRQLLRKEMTSVWISIQRQTLRSRRYQDPFNKVQHFVNNNCAVYKAQHISKTSEKYHLLYNESEWGLEQSSTQEDKKKAAWCKLIRFISVLKPCYSFKWKRWKCCHCLQKNV